MPERYRQPSPRSCRGTLSRNITQHTPQYDWPRLGVRRLPQRKLPTLHTRCSVLILITLSFAQDPLSATAPLTPQPVSEPSLIQNLDIVAAPNASGNLVFLVNNSTFRANYTASLLSAASEGITTYPSHPEYNVYDFSRETSVRIIIRNMFPVMHNMHLHGHESFSILAEGRGEWDGTITRPENPQRRDSAQMSWGTPNLPAYLVIQFDTDNPGVWPLHCHLVVHASAGLYVNVVEKPEGINKQKVNEVVQQTCPSWEKWVKENGDDQFDSGLKVRGLDLRRFKKRTVDVL